MDDHLARYLEGLRDCAGFDDEPVHPWTRGRTGDTPLHIAALNGEVTVIEPLLDEGADLNAQGEAGYTPLRYAVLMEKPEALRLLLAKGADTSIRDDQGDTPLDAAEWCTNAQILRILQNHLP